MPYFLDKNRTHLCPSPKLLYDILKPFVQEAEKNKTQIPVIFRPLLLPSKKFSANLLASLASVPKI